MLRVNEVIKVIPVLVLVIVASQRQAGVGVKERWREKNNIIMELTESLTRTNEWRIEQISEKCKRGRTYHATHTFHLFSIILIFFFFLNMWEGCGKRMEGFYSKRTETTLKNYVIQLIHSKYKRTMVAVTLTRQLRSEFKFAQS